VDLKTYGAALFFLLSAEPVARLIQQPEAGLRWNGAMAAVLALGGAAVVLRQKRNV
jgi:hypothetical protein